MKNLPQMFLLYLIAMILFGCCTELGRISDAVARMGGCR